MSAVLPYSTTAGDLCLQALKESGAIGVGQTPLAEDSLDALARLNWMIQQWMRKRWMVWHLLDLSVTSTGAQSYTVGPGGQIDTNNVEGYALQALTKVLGGAAYAANDTITLTGGAIVKVLTVVAGVIATFSILTPGSYTGVLPISFAQISTSGVGAGATFNTPVWYSLGRVTGGRTMRPDKLAYAFLRQITQTTPNQIDYSLRILEAREDYSRIALKSLTSFPQWAFYDSSWTLGQLFAWPVPQASIYALHVGIKEQITNFDTLATVVNFPYEMYEAILYNLAMRLRNKYGIGSPPGDMLPGLAKASMATVRGANTQIARLQIPGDLSRGSIYNIFSDQSY